ncbi:unnamed protein product [Victoria cruziana]
MDFRRPSSLDEYDKLVIRMNTPRVVIDNAVCATATLVKVDSAREHGILLEAVQVLTDLNLCIRKAYIASDGKWFMDVFHVTDHNGNKLRDESVLSCIQRSLATRNTASPTSLCSPDETALELTGTDRPGLLSEVFAVLTELHCSVVNASVWTHRGRIASVIHVKDEESGSPIEDAHKISCIEDRLRSVLKGDSGDIRRAKTAVAMDVTHTERRLHQLMFADRDYERIPAEPSTSPPTSSVTVQNCLDRGYSVVGVQCKDRPKLLFDIVCTLTDMQYVVFHATIYTHFGEAFQEFYIRHADGCPVNSEAERRRVIQCLRAAIERRATEGLKLELRTSDRRGLLSEVTRTFRENGLLVTRAEVSTVDGQAVNTFYVSTAAGNPVDPKTIDSVRSRVGAAALRVKEDAPSLHENSNGGRSSEAHTGLGGGTVLLSLSSLVWRNLYNLGLIRSYS